MVLESLTDYGHGITNKTFISPFISRRKIRADSHFAMSVQNFNTTMNDNSLWSPTENVSHAEWITTLTCTLLSVFSSNCFLKSLIPVCKVEVRSTKLRQIFGATQCTAYLLGCICRETVSITHISSVVFQPGVLHNNNFGSSERFLRASLESHGIGKH